MSNDFVVFSQDQEGEDDGLTAQLTGRSIFKANLFDNIPLKIRGPIIC